MYSEYDVLSYIEEENVKFIRLSFCDVTGREKNTTIMPGELKRAFTDGISFDASAIAGFGNVTHSDLFLFPDPSTLSIVPWHPVQGKMVRMICGIKTASGERFPYDSRFILEQAVNKAKKKGYHFGFGAEYEFYLFKTDEQGERTLIPFDNAGYMDIDPGDKCESIRREICFTLSDMGIYPESAHHEEGPGQNEINFRYSEPLKAADNSITFKSVVRTIAIRNGLHANFSPKPLENQPGNGFHINMSVKSNDGNEYGEKIMAGVMEHIKEMTAYLNPTQQSYMRLGKMKAPKYIAWSPENRSQLIRIPAAKGDFKRIELRSPDPGANPYIAYALLIHAGIDGITRNLTPVHHLDADMYSTEGELTTGLDSLPSTLEEAKAIANKSEWIKGILPAGFAFV
jgi:glutamine synthetase